MRQIGAKKMRAGKHPSRVTPRTG